MFIFYVFLVSALLTTIASQIITKSHMSTSAEFPSGYLQRLDYLVTNLFSLPLLTAFFLTCLGALFWILALAKIPLTQAYPVMLLNFPAVMLAGHFIFREQLSPNYFLGALMIVFGLLLILFSK